MAPRKPVMLFGVDLKRKLKPKKIKSPKLIKFGDLIKPKTRFPAPVPQKLPLKYLNLVLKNGVNKADLRLILVKRLERTDINPHQARLSMPKEKVAKGILNGEEEKFLKGTNSNGGRVLKNRLNVLVVDPRLVVRNMKLAKWNDSEPKEGEKKKKSWWFALTSDWIDLVSYNGLGVGDVIQVWSFRTVKNSLGFIIHKTEEGLGSDSDSDTDSDSGSSSGSNSGSSAIDDNNDCSSSEKRASN